MLRDTNICNYIFFFYYFLLFFSLFHQNTESKREKNEWTKCFTAVMKEKSFYFWTAKVAWRRKNVGIVVILSAHFFSFIFLSSNNCVDVNKTTRGSFSNNFSMSFLESTCQPRCYTLKHTLLLQCCYLNCIFVALILFTLLFFLSGWQCATCQVFVFQKPHFFTQQHPKTMKTKILCVQKWLQ